jgi:hypothetical protein
VSTRGWLVVAAFCALWLLTYPIIEATGAWWLVTLVGSVTLGAMVYAVLVAWAKPPVEAEAKRTVSPWVNLWILPPLWMFFLWYNGWTITALAFGVAATAWVTFDVARGLRARRPERSH